MRHRIFIAINIPEKVKTTLVSFQSRWPELPIRWIKKQNIHITLVFLGYIQDKEIPEVLKITEQISQKHDSFSINLNRICYGPPKKMPPRMVWATGEISEQLGKLQRDLEDSFFSSPVKKTHKSKNRAYCSHINLGRIHQWEFRQIEPEERPQIEEDISLSFPVDSIEIMESHLKRTGAEYVVLNSFKLK